mmetsp:Transcript_763/g.1770  ORF Transcript_763/g.1770 Transcript_763/m.1770 type:complete len:430 (-) Transcript_763:38-1327(-)
MAPRQAGVRAADANHVGDYVQPALEKKLVKPEDISFLGDHHAGKPLLQRLNFLHVGIIFGVPALALYGLATWTFNWPTIALAVGYYWWSGLGITAGYHRMFAHKAYKVQPWFEWVLACMGAAAVEGSIKWWSRDHRAHHRYVDTQKDPYSSSKGFWHAHVGWMLCKQEPGRIGHADIQDLKDNIVVATQHKFYGLFALVWGFLVPSALGALWGDAYGGFFIAGCARLVFVHHSTFCVNSVAHWAGDQTYTDGHTARNSIITALLTVGEGYHNFHHEFPSDYRNGVEWYQYDPTKWFIRALEMAGIAVRLQRFSKNEIAKGELQMKNKALHDEMSRIFWGPDPAVLPTYTMEEVTRIVTEEGAPWLVIEGFVVDAKDFMEEHPGGIRYIKNMLGKDATEAFTGETYRHSNAAHNTARTLRVGRIVKSKSE